MIVLRDSSGTNEGQFGPNAVPSASESMSHYSCTATLVNKHSQLSYWPWVGWGHSVAQRQSLCPSCEVSEHSEENALKKWPKMWHADVSRPPPEIIRIWPVLAQFWSPGGQKISEIGVSGHSKENAWKEWLKMWHAYVSWPPSEND